MSKKIDEVMQSLKRSGETIRLGEKGQIYLRYDQEKGVWRYSDFYIRENVMGDYLLTDEDAKKELKRWKVYEPVEQLSITGVSKK